MLPFRPRFWAVCLIEVDPAGTEQGGRASKPRGLTQNRPAAVTRCDWEVRMRSVSLLAAAVIGVSALAVACGQQAGPAAGGSSSRPAPATAPPAAAGCGSATPTAPPNRTLTLTA